MAKKRAKQTSEDVDLSQLLKDWEGLTYDALMAILEDVPEPTADMLKDVHIPVDPLPPC